MKIFIVLLCLTLLSSCATTEQRRKRFVSAHPGMRDAYKSAVLRGTIVEGMHIKAVRASWGKPKKKYKKPYGRMPALHWEYDVIEPDRIATYVLIFRKGILLKWQLKHAKPLR